MADALGGKWKVAKPLSEECSRGWNLYLPIPYAKHCKVTSDSDGFYYQVNYRTYAAGTAVQSMTLDSISVSAEAISRTNGILAPTGTRDRGAPPGFVTIKKAVAPGERADVALPKGPGVIKNLQLLLQADDRSQAMRSTVLSAEFDGEPCVWVPAGEFFANGFGQAEARTFWFTANQLGGECTWPMPYQNAGTMSITNLGTQPVSVTLLVSTYNWSWDDRSMHFHAAWHAEYPIHAYGGRGTKDWNYLEATGKGVYVGDSLAIMNPVPEWWGEGDEKIFVDGEKFPSHFGTGTEDYYGYAWSSNVPFQHPFHAQPRCDGQKPGNNWGHSTVSRVRALDAIPFTTSFKFDMEIWHWRECDVAYAATTYFYAKPGVTTNRAPQPDEAAKPIPQAPPLPPPFEIAGAIECESMTVLAKSPDTSVGPQDLRSFGQRQWSGESQLWVQGKDKGAFVELEIPTGPGPEGKKRVEVTLYATKSWDYGIVRFTVNGSPATEDVDLFSGERGKAVPSGPIGLGIFEPRDGRLVLRAEVVGANPRAEGTKSFFGLDCVVLTLPSKP